MANISICNTCWPYLKAEAESDASLQHHTSFSSLISSVDQGCHFCTDLWQAFSKNVRDLVQSSPELLDYRPDNASGLVLCHCFQIEPNDHFEGWPNGTYHFTLYFEFRQTNLHTVDSRFPEYGLMDRPCSSEWLLIPRTIHRQESLTKRVASTTTNSQEALKTAMSWLTDCTESHNICRAVHNDPFYPTRLLDVRSSETLKTVILVPKWKVFSNSEYNTLSHCWGQSKFYQLIRDTVLPLETGLGIHELPRAFQDAIELTRAMNVPYLWIDSLCIQQDDPEDWLRESKQMHKIYSSAHCNIAATAGTSNKQGLYRLRDSDCLRRLSLEIPASPNPRALPAGHYDLIDGKYYMERLGTAPLNMRAWVVQERLLAKRVLHFTEREVMWECKAMTASETWPAGIPGPWRHRFKMLTEGYPLSKTLVDPRNIDPRWQAVATSCSNAVLTYSDDRIVAISGIAKVFQQVLQDRYIVGMWEKTLITELLWGCTFFPQDRASVRKTQSTIPPSFSWLSVEHSVSFQDVEGPEEKACVEIAECKFDYITDDETGPVRSGYILLVRQLREVYLVSTQRLGRERVQGDSYWEVQLKGDTLPCCVSPDLQREDLPVSSQGRRHFLVPFFHGGEHVALRGLILESLDCSPCAFRRIGTFVILSEAGDVESILSPQANEDRFPCTAYNSVTLQHTICIR